MGLPAAVEFGVGDFSSGMWRAVAKHKIPRNGAYDLQNALIDDDGVVYMRGRAARYGTQITSGPAIGGLWDVACLPGRRTIAAGSGYVAPFSSVGPTPVRYSAAAIAPVPGPLAKVGDWVFIPGGAAGTGGILYAGSLRSANVSSPGTITVTANSPTITGVGTTFSGTVDVGMILSLWIAGSANKRPYIVKSVDSNTQLTLTEPIRSDEPVGAGLTTWQLSTLVLPSAPSSTAMETTTSGGLIAAPIAAGAMAAVANKLWLADGRRVYQSYGPDPSSGLVRPFDFPGATVLKRPGVYGALWFHEMPSDVVALAPLRDRLLVFCQDGMYLISGCAFDLVDAQGNPQQRVERVSDRVIAQSSSGVCPLDGAVVVAARDGCYIVDSLGQPELLTRSISPYWRSLVAGGSAPGMPAVYQGHLFVPMGSGQVLTCRLDRAQQSRVGVVYPWTRQANYLGACRAFAVKDPNGSPKLIGGSTDGYLLDCNVFTTGAAATDGNGQTPQLVVETGEFEPDGGSETFVRRARLDYTSDSTIGMTVKRRWQGGGTEVSYTAPGTAPANSSQPDPYTFGVSRAVRGISFKLTSSGSPTTCRILSVTGIARPRGRRR